MSRRRVRATLSSTFNADGSIFTSLGNTSPYDLNLSLNGEDQLVGIVNNSGHTITTIHLSNPGVDIFGFDNDGICFLQPFVQPADNGTCASSSATDPGDYLGAAISFSGINGAKDTGDVNFAGILTGTTSFFSLEEPASLNLQVGQTPESSTWVLIGAGLAGLYVGRRRLKTA
jgi:hypothetical protein